MNYRKEFNTFEEFRDATLEGVHNAWLTEAFLDEYTNSLKAIWSTAEYAEQNFVPAARDILRACRVPPGDVKVILVAQDPYPRANYATGLAFHANGMPTASLRSMKRNLRKYGHVPDNADWGLAGWVEQGVLLLNITLTTVEGKSNAHVNLWKGTVEKLLAVVPRDSIVMLLGRNAREMRNIFPSKRAVEHCHPVARGNEFISEDVFGEVNRLLETAGKNPIDWRFT